MKKVLSLLFCAYLLLVHNACVQSQTVDVDAFQKGLQNKNAQFLDVRSSEEFVSGHIKGAMLAPIQDGDELLSNRNDVSEYDYDAIVRPREGDIIWVPMLKAMYEIKFTENIENFYQLGKLYTYEMRCDRLEYSSERINTDVADIDGIEDQYSLSTTNREKLLDEDTFLFLHEDDTFIVNEADVVVAAEISADNEEIGQKIIDDDILDFSEQNPFSLTRTF